MFEGPVTEVLDNGEVTDGTHVTAGQLAPYAHGHCGQRALLAEAMEPFMAAVV